MSETFQVRAAERGDVGTILAMIRELAEYEELTHLCTATEDQLAAELFGPDAAAEALVAVAGGEAVGYAIFFHNFSTFLGRRGLYLEDLYVRPSHRHQGCGRALLLAVARIAAERRCARFEWMALDWNTPAIDFYEKLGATQMREWRLFRATGDALDALAKLK
ncbi:MAG: acetyltransferase domain protein [Rhodocyclales bacterium]|nr:acetyltransferase domain protein [Rhodocyclales bacterium]